MRKAMLQSHADVLGLWRISEFPISFADMLLSPPMLPCYTYPTLSLAGVSLQATRSHCGSTIGRDTPRTRLIPRMWLTTMGGRTWMRMARRSTAIIVSWERYCCGEGWRARYCGGERKRAASSLDLCSSLPRLGSMNAVMSPWSATLHAKHNLHLQERTISPQPSLYCYCTTFQSAQGRH
jgi:hypothetical protein